MNHRIETKDTFTVVAIKKRFNPDTSATAIPAFWEHYFSTGLDQHVKGMLGLCQMIPGSTDFFYAIGGPLQPGKATPDGFERLTIPASTWLVFTAIGAMPDAIQNLWKAIYRQFFPNERFEPLGTYEIEVYTEGDTTSPDYVSEIWIPVKEKR
ncbi:MAG: AraC family transcriptional regulator [Acholeplasmataceae bacterium]|nr:MAG: AraC family transcriptional regulator [Acholeplasmataceae bacterium]